MILIATALECEAKPIIEFFKLKWVNDPYFRIYKNDQIMLIVTGVSFKCMGAVGYIFGKYPISCFLNVGIAAHKSFEIGSAFLIHKASYKNRALYPVMILDELSEELLTGEMIEVFEKNTLHDMECYFMFDVAAKFLNFEMIQGLKIVSDNEKNKKIEQDEISKLIKMNIDKIEKIVKILRSMIKESFDKNEFKIYLTESEKIKVNDLMARITLHEKEFKVEAKDAKELVSILEKRARELTLCLIQST